MLIVQVYTQMFWVLVQMSLSVRSCSIVKAFESEWKCWMPGLVLQTCLVTALPRNLAELGCGWYSYRLEIWRKVFFFKAMAAWLLAWTGASVVVLNKGARSRKFLGWWLKRTCFCWCFVSIVICTRPDCWSMMLDNFPALHVANEPRFKIC